MQGKGAGRWRNPFTGMLELGSPLTKKSVSSYELDFWMTMEEEE